MWRHPQILLSRGRASLSRGIRNYRRTEGQEQKRQSRARARMVPKGGKEKHCHSHSSGRGGKVGKYDGRDLS